MSISAISPNSGSSDPTIQSGQKAKDDFNQLGQALQSGDLASAQAAFQALQNDASKLKADAAASAKSDKVQQDLATVGKALQNGDVSGAQDAFAKLQQDVKAHGKHGHHQHPQSAYGSTSANSSNGAVSATIGNNINVAA
jgi:hypothetical protein